MRHGRGESPGLRDVALGALLMALGCASPPRDAGYATVEQTVAERGGPDLRWSESSSGSDGQGSNDAGMPSLTEPLTVEGAVQVAMMNNRALQATFEQLGIARGDLVEAGLLPNPNFAGRVRWSEAASTTNPELTLTWDVMDVVRRSKRADLAQTELDRIAFEVTDDVLGLTSAVRNAFYDLQAAEQVRRMHVEVFRAAKATADLATRQRGAGNINELESAIEQSVFQDARLDLIQSEAAAKSARVELARVTGLTAADTTWSVVSDLPQIPPDDPALGTLEAMALSGRLDLMAARKDVDAGMRDVSYQKSFFMLSLEIGVDAERGFDDQWAYGPIVQMALPIFDRGQGNVARAQARVRQSEHAAAALETDIRNDVRDAWDKLQSARQMVEIYRDDMIPAREKVVAETQRHYNFMLTGPMTLLQAKRDEIDAYQKYIESVRDYWNARSALERAVATSLDGVNQR